MTQDIYLTSKDLEEAKKCGLTINVNMADDTNINIGECCVNLDKMVNDYYMQNNLNMFDYDVIKDAYITGALKAAEGVLKNYIKTGKELPSQKMKLYLVLLSDRSMCLGYYDNNSWWEFRNFPEKIDVVKWLDFNLFDLWK